MRTAANRRIITKNALERCIITESPCCASREVLNKGYARTSEPMANAAAAHEHGMRKEGRTNIVNPVAIPSGGMMILLIETGVRPSRTRQRMTAASPTKDPINDIQFVMCISWRVPYSALFLFVTIGCDLDHTRVGPVGDGESTRIHRCRW